ncbi:hypothetical protein JMUB6875_18570 [Nocardia sp. JMUB6875]|uniref:hypothetical protein n=1 Tax=Nocardia sp. JMUB6875 TaxID=3158170 RepID=UPI0032E5E336
MIVDGMRSVPEMRSFSEMRWAREVSRSAGMEGRLTERVRTAGWTGSPVIGEIVTSSSLLEKDRQ